jgi:Gluconate 2-dehydrogenase subunit 3
MTAMRRRDFVKGLVAVPVAAKTVLGQQPAASQSTGTPVASPSPAPEAAPPAPIPPTAPPQSLRRAALGFKTPPIAAVVPDAVAETEAHFFNEDQMATLHKLSDVLMPALNGYPGAVAAGAPEFLDFLIGASPADRQQMYQFGLDRLNSDAHKQFGVPFAEVNPEQADKLIRPWLATWMNDHPPKEPFSRFINVAHRDIRTATMNSQAWSEAATSSGERAPGVGMYWSPIDPDIQRYV